jgi:hypothetical protein
MEDRRHNGRSQAFSASGARRGAAEPSVRPPLNWHEGPLGVPRAAPNPARHARSRLATPQPPQPRGIGYCAVGTRGGDGPSGR